MLLPALANYWSRTRITYNAVNSILLRTDDAPVESIHLTWAGKLSRPGLSRWGIMPSKQVSSVTCLLLTAEFKRSNAFG